MASSQTVNPIAMIGAAFLGLLAQLGRFGLFTGKAICHVLTPPYFPRLIGRQLMQMGFSKEASVAALQKAQGSVEAATDILLGGFQ